MKLTVSVAILLAIFLYTAQAKTLYESNVKVPSAMANAIFSKNIKVGSYVTGVPTSKFEKFAKYFTLAETSTQTNVGFNEELGMHVGLGAATVTDRCNRKVQIVVVAKQSSNLQKLKANLEKALKSKMNRPPTRCSRRLRGAGTETLYATNVNVPTAMAHALLSKNIKPGSYVTGIPLSKFDRLRKSMQFVDSMHEIHVGFDAESGTYVGLGALTVRDVCNEKTQIVVVAKRSTSSQRLKAALAKDMKSKMNRPPTRCL